MAIVNAKTASINTEDLAGETVASAGRPMFTKVATIEVAASDDNGSTFRLMRLPGAAILTSLELASDALGTSASYDLGVYDLAANGGAVVDADEFASALNLASAVAWTNVLEEAVATDISKIGQPLWQRLGFAADPGKSFDIVATANTAGDAAGTLSLRARYYFQ